MEHKKKKMIMEHIKKESFGTNATQNLKYINIDIQLL